MGQTTNLVSCFGQSELASILFSLLLGFLLGSCKVFIGLKLEHVSSKSVSQQLACLWFCHAISILRFTGHPFECCLALFHLFLDNHHFNLGAFVT